MLSGIVPSSEAWPAVALASKFVLRQMRKGQTYRYSRVLRDHRVMQMALFAVL